MNTAVPSGVTLTSVESMEIQTSGSLGVAEVSPVTPLSAVKEIDTWNFPAATLSSITLASSTIENGDTLDVDADGIGAGVATTITYDGVTDNKWKIGATAYDSLALAVAAAVNAQSTTATAFVGTDGLVYTKADLTAWTFTYADAAAPAGTLTATKGTDADALVPGGKFSVAYGTSTLVTAALDATPTQAEAMTLIANAINAMAGSTVATVVGDYMTVSAPVAGTALPSYSVTYWANGTNTTANPSSYAVAKQDTVANQAARDAVTGVAGQAYDVSGFTDTTDVSVTTSNGMALKAAATQNVTVSGATGTVTVSGGKDVTVTDATADKAITVGNGAAGGDAAGKITITDTNNTGTAAITTEGGTDVTITTTANKASSGNIVVGHATNGQASGAVVVTQNTTNDATAAITAGNVTVTGGSTVNITANMTNTAVKAGTTGNNITAGTFTVTAGNTTTDVTVTQVATATDFANDASLGTKETSVVTFGALKAGEKVAISAGTLTTDSFANPTTSTDLVFTASKDLTAAEVAAAFASLTNADIQAAGGKVANGIFTGTLDAGWTSGAANGAAVTFTATAVGDATNEITVTTRNAGDADVALDSAKFGAVATNGTAPAASTLVDVTADFGAVVIDDNATASIKTVTLDGYDTATIGNTTALTALTTVSLSNSSGANIIDNGATATALTLNLNKITGATDIDNGAASVTDLTVNTSGAASSTVLTAAELKNLTVSGSQLLTLTTSTLTKLDKVVVSGTAGLTIGGTNEVDTVTSVNTSATTGTTTIAIDGTKATYVGGAGVDVVTLATGTALTKSIDLGAGDDTLVFSADVTGSSTTLSGGDGTDTLSMSVARADALDASAVSFYTNFERLTLNNANTAALTVDLANLGFTNYVTTSGTAGVVYTGAGTAASATEKFTFVYNGVEYTATLAGTDAAAFNTAIDTAVITGTTTQLGVNKVTATLTNTAADLTIVADDAANTLTAGVYNDTSTTATITGTDQALTLNKLAANATVVLTKDGAVTATLADATGSSDVVNVVANVAAANIDFGTFTAANVETINITANDTKADDNGDGTTTTAESAPEKATLTLTADKATTVNVTGSAAVALTLTGSTKVATLDGSSMTGALTVTSVSTDAAIVMKGGSANDTLISAATSTKADELHGGAGNDSLTANKGMTKMYGGEGADTFNIVVASTNVNSAATIMDLGSGDVIKFAGADAFKSAAVTLDTTAVFQDFANAAIASITSDNDLAWFQFGGNTYIVQEKNATNDPNVFMNDQDFIVKIAGLVDLSTASFNATSGTLEIA